MNFTSTTYSITAIGPLQGDTMSDATDVNALGNNNEGQELQAAGYSTADNVGLGVFADGGKRRAFLWGKKPPYLIGLDAQDFKNVFLFGQALGINNIFPSQVVGWGSDGGGPTPVLWEGPANAARTTSLNTLGGKAGQARSVNDLGHIVGWAQTGEGKRHAFLWTFGGKNGPQSNPQMQDLGTLGGDESDAYRINNSDQVVGWAHTANGEVHAFLWTLGGKNGPQSNPQMQDLGAANFAKSMAFGINNQGNVVGMLDTTAADDQLGDSQAFFWTPNGGMQAPLGDLGGPPTFATAINDSDTVVGSSGTVDQQGQPAGSRAFVWSDGVMNSLTGLVHFLSKGQHWVLTRANGINSRGQIVGYGRDPNGQLRAWLLTPHTKQENLGIVPLALGAYVVGIIGNIPAGGGGLEILPSGQVIITPPTRGDPIGQSSSPAMQDVLNGLILSEMASVLNNVETGRRIRELALNMVYREVQQLIRSLEKG